MLKLKDDKTKVLVISTAFLLLIAHVRLISELAMLVSQHVTLV